MVSNLLKSKKLPIGVFAGLKKAPGPARIFVTLQYSEKFEWLRGVRGFKFRPLMEPRIIQFEIPVTPPTIEIDFGNQKDTENVARVGEVVLPKYAKAWQIRWESFFPYDNSAPYLNTSVKGLTSLESLKQVGRGLASIGRNVASAVTGGLVNLSQTEPTPAFYLNVFNTLSKLEEPFTVSMTFYDGGSLPSAPYTLDSFKCEPENNGDYKYSLSIVQWTDIKPKLLNPDGTEVVEPSEKVKDSSKNKVIKGVSDFFNFCKRCYPTVSKNLIWAFAQYNGVRNLIFDGTLKLWKIKGSLQDLGGRFGIVSNIIGVAKITSKDTQAVSQALKNLSYTKASKQMADFLKQNMKV